MIELIIKEFVEQKLSAPLFFEFPEDAPDRFVVLYKGDSGRENLLDSAMIVANSYGSSLVDAAQLNEEVKSILDALIEMDRISSSRRGGDYPFYDTKNNRHRYQAVQNITHY